MPSVLELMNRPHRGVRAPRARMSIKERIGRNVTVDPITECWVWTGRLMNAGYGQLTYVQVGYKTVTLLAHRASYEVHIGEIPQGKYLDHLCRVRACVNPGHLEPVVPRENVMRSPIAQGALNAAKTHCAKGHPYSPENTYVYDMRPTRSTTTRICKTCRSEWRKKSRSGGAA